VFFVAFARALTCYRLQKQISADNGAVMQNMRDLCKNAGVALVLVSMAGCFAPAAQKAAAPFKGEPLKIRYILGAHPNKEACVECRAATNTCTSILVSEVEGDVMISRERTLKRVAGTQVVREVEILTRHKLDRMKACRGVGDVQIKGRDLAAADALQTAERNQIARFGGSVCNTYFRSGHGYVMSSTGANGKLYPSGDISYQYIFEGDLALRFEK
jgi:hypothetical protein